jgi:hypothetical protein
MQIAPYNAAQAVTKSDTVNFAPVAGRLLCDALWVGGAGIVVAVFEDGTTANFTCVAGTLLPLRIKRVNSTTTTATLMAALYQV